MIKSLAERDWLDSFIWFVSFNQTNQIDSIHTRNHSVLRFTRRGVLRWRTVSTRLSCQTSTFTSVPSTFTSYRSTLAAGFATQAPVVTSYCQPCQGQVTTDPSSSPSPSGPPRWMQVLSIAWNVRSTLNTARVLPFTSATIPWPGFTSSVPVTRTNSPIASPVLTSVGYVFANGFLILLSRLSIGGTPFAAPVTSAIIFCAISRNAADCGDAGSATTIGLPESPPSRIAGSIGTRPRNGTPSVAAARSPPPCENNSGRSPQ